MKPLRVWRHEGPHRCDRCACVERTVYVAVKGLRGEVCWGCLKSAIGKRLQRALAERFDGEEPAGPTGLRFLRSSWEIEFPLVVEAIRLRLYVTPKEARDAGHPSWESAIRDSGVALSWILGMDADIDAIIRKVIKETDQEQGSPDFADEEAA